MRNKIVRYWRELSPETRFLILFVLVFPYTLGTLFIDPIKDIYTHSPIAAAPYKLLQDGYGKAYALPGQLVETEQWLKKYQLKNFNVSDEFMNSSYNYQRLVESNYPVIPSKTARYWFYLPEEALPEGCKIIESNGVVHLVRC